MDKKALLLKYVPFILIMIVAIVLRLFYINADLWYDEACSWFSAKQSFPFGIMDNLLELDLQHTPLYFFGLHFWMKIFGDSEIALKSLSLIFSIATIPLTYFVAKKIMAKFYAYCVTLVVAVSPLLVFFSTEVRMYPFAVFWVLVSINYLIDYEKKQENKSLWKMLGVNLLIPYTLVGGIYYNISLALCYGAYLYKNKKDNLKIYLKFVGLETILLIPYIILISYYAKMREIFVIKHEGQFVFWHFVEVIRNFFSPDIVSNPYWPTESSYDMNFSFVLFILIPCGYFICGYINGLMKSKGFLRCLYNIFFLVLGLAVILSVFEVNVFTARYVLYLLIPFFILAILGLSENLNRKHFIGFIIFFVTSSMFFVVRDNSYLKTLKTYAFADVRNEALSLGLTSEDMIIMPFGADAPYYFRKINTPRVHMFDLHKQLRNPYNNNYYDKTQQDLMAKDGKYSVVYDSVFADKCFSDNFVQYFLEDVNNTTDSGRYVLIALYGKDAESVVHISDLRKSVSNVQDVKRSMISVMMAKYLFDVQHLLSKEFEYVKSYTKNNYTYHLFKKL